MFLILFIKRLCFCRNFPTTHKLPEDTAMHFVKTALRTRWCNTTTMPTSQEGTIMNLAKVGIKPQAPPRGSPLFYNRFTFLTFKKCFIKNSKQNNKNEAGL